MPPAPPDGYAPPPPPPVRPVDVKDDGQTQCEEILTFAECKTLQENSGKPWYGDTAIYGDAALGCYTGHGTEYDGIAATTGSGRICQAWTSQTPHAHTHTPLQLNGVPLTADQPDTANTAYSVDGGGVLEMSSSAVHNAWNVRDGALVLYASMPAEPWAAAVRVQMSANAGNQALLSRSKKQSQDQPVRLLGRTWLSGLPGAGAPAC